MFAQLDITALGSNPKTWLVAIGGLILSMIVGRFVQAFRNGEGIKGAACAVWLGTNQPKQSPPQPQQQPAQQGNDNMKTIVSLIAILGLSLSLTAKAQTLNTNGVPSVDGPAMDAIRFLSASSTNWMVAPYGIATSDGKYGGGIAAAYKLSDYVAPTMRLDYFDGKVWMPSADLQLQAPLTLFGKLTLVPFAFTGIATPIAGKGSANGSVVGMFGAGAAVRLSSHLDLVGDVEKWTGFSGQQYRFGILYKF